MGLGRRMGKTTLVITYTGPVSGSHDLTTGALYLTTPGSYTIASNQPGREVRVKGAAAGGNASGGIADSTRSFGGGGGGSGAVDLVGVVVAITSAGFTFKVGDAAGDKQTRFREDASTIHLQLEGGGNALDPDNPGAGGTATTGSASKDDGVAGGVGADEALHGPGSGTANANGAAGGAGGGFANGSGAAGGNGEGESGGAAGSAGNPGGDTQAAVGGGPGSGDSGGGGGAGGGATFGSFKRGGGGGGGAGSRSSGGNAGAGSHGIGVISLP